MQMIAVDPSGNVMDDQHVKDACNVGACLAVSFIVRKDATITVCRRLAFSSGSEALESSRQWQDAASSWRTTVLAGTIYFDRLTAIDQLHGDDELKAQIGEWMGQHLEALLAER